jgi:anthranilate phosphoribosyltransferase
MLLVSETESLARLVEPEDVGLPRSRGIDLQVPAALTPEEVFASILECKAPPAWIDLCAFATSAILVHARAVTSLTEGVRRAQQLFSSGEVAAKVHRLKAQT